MFSTLTAVTLSILATAPSASASPLPLGPRALAFETLPGSGGYRARSAGASVLLREGGIDVQVGGQASPCPIRLRFVAPAGAARPVGVGELPGRVSFLRGGDPARWAAGLPTFGEVVYRQPWPGIDLQFHGSPGQLEHDFVVAPGADPSRIALAVEGQDELRLEPDGALRIEAGDAWLRLEPPIAYQQLAGRLEPVAARFVLQAPDRFGFELGARDPGATLVIDPLVAWSTFLGGTADDALALVAIDGPGNLYVAGRTSSSDFPLAGAAPAPFEGLDDVFVSKLDPTGSTLLYSTYIGGSEGEWPAAIAVDPAGRVHLAGATGSADFPVRNALQPAYRGRGDAFVLRLDRAGSALEFSTYLGGWDRDLAFDLALDAGGSAYVVGSSKSADFPLVDPLQPARPGSESPFLAKLDPGGAALVFSTWFGGSQSTDWVHAVRADPFGSVYIAGEAASSDLPLLCDRSPDPVRHRGFVARLDERGQTMLFCQEIDGLAGGQVTALALDAVGGIYIAGWAEGAGLPVTRALQPTFAGGADFFVGKLAPLGGSWLYLTYLGGQGLDAEPELAVTLTGEVLVAGWTMSPDFPIVGGPRHAFTSSAAVVAKLSADGRRLLWSAQLGGDGASTASAVAAAPDFVAVAGSTRAGDFPTVAPRQAALAGGSDAFVTRLEDGSCARPPDLGPILRLAPITGAVCFRWTDLPGTSRYLLWEAHSRIAAFDTFTGSAASGQPGPCLYTAEPLVFYRLAAENACGRGPI